MKNRIKVAGFLVLALFLVAVLLSYKPIAGYSFVSFANERLEIIPPPYMEDELEPIVIDDQQVINRFIETIEKSTLDDNGEGYRAIMHYRDNDKPYIAIRLTAQFPERIIGWEYLNEGNQAYLYPTLSNKNGESYTPSPEFVSWMDEQINTYWNELTNNQ